MVFYKVQITFLSPPFLFLEVIFTRIKSYLCAFRHRYPTPGLVFDACQMSPTVTRVTGSFFFFFPVAVTSRKSSFLGEGL